jgi:hypothetical protein
MLVEKGGQAPHPVVFRGIFAYPFGASPLFNRLLAREPCDAERTPANWRSAMKKISMLLCLLLTALIAGQAWAKRAAPKPVAPVVHEGVKYAAPNENGREGKIEARDEKTGKKLWDAVIYTIKIDPNLEEDVQWVFIAKLAIQKNALAVTDEKNEKYLLDLKTKKVEKEKKVPKKT